MTDLDKKELPPPKARTPGVSRVRGLRRSADPGKPWATAANRILRSAGSCALLFVLAGCSSTDPTADVEKRAVDRWNYLITHQAEKAYDYLSPGTRETQTRESYAAAMNNRPVKWTAVKFNRKECDADRCKVYVDVSYSLSMPGMGGGKPVDSKSTQSEIWVRVDDGWYYLPK